MWSLDWDVSLLELYRYLTERVGDYIVLSCSDDSLEARRRARQEAENQSDRRRKRFADNKLRTRYLYHHPTSYLMRNITMLYTVQLADQGYRHERLVFPFRFGLAISRPTYTYIMRWIASSKIVVLDIPFHILIQHLCPFIYASHRAMVSSHLLLLHNQRLPNPAPEPLARMVSLTRIQVITIPFTLIHHPSIPHILIRFESSTPAPTTAQLS